MILKATTVGSVSHARQLGQHLLKRDENELVQVHELSGVATQDLIKGLADMQRLSELTQGKTGLFHVAINPQAHHSGELTPEQWEGCLSKIENEFSLSGQPRAVVQHIKDGRSHYHVVYQLTDPDTCKLKRLSMFKIRCKSLGESLERELGHERTNREPSRKSYSRDEQQQAKRRGETVKDRRETIREIFEASRDSKDFEARLAAAGYTIAKGDRAALVMVNGQGDVFNLSRELGMKLGEVKQYFNGIERDLPELSAVKVQLKARSSEPAPRSKAEEQQLLELFKETGQDVAQAQVKTPAEQRAAANDNTKPIQPEEKARRAANDNRPDERPPLPPDKPTALEKFKAFEENAQEQVKAPDRSPTTAEQKLAAFREDASEIVPPSKQKTMADYLKEAEELLAKSRERNRGRDLDR